MQKISQQSVGWSMHSGREKLLWILEAIRVFISWRLLYLPRLSSSLAALKKYWRKSEKTAAMPKFCALIFLVYLTIGADAGKKKFCRQIMDKLSDLEDLIKKKQDCCKPGKI